MKAFSDNSNLVPSVALLTAWQNENASATTWEPVIRFLLDRGCSYFACVGTYSEDLHDAIDDLFYQRNNELGVQKNRDIVTTYHVGEPTEDVVAYFVHGTELRN